MTVDIEKQVQALTSFVSDALGVLGQDKAGAGALVTKIIMREPSLSSLFDANGLLRKDAANASLAAILAPSTKGDEFAGPPSVHAPTGFQGTGLTEALFLALHPLERMRLIDKVAHEKREREKKTARDKENAEELAALPANWAEYTFNMRQHHIEQRATAKRAQKAAADVTA